MEWFAAIVASTSPLGDAFAREHGGEEPEATQLPGGEESDLRGRQRIIEYQERQQFEEFLNWFYESGEALAQRQMFNLIAGSLSPALVAIFKQSVMRVAQQQMRKGFSGIGFMATGEEFVEAAKAETLGSVAAEPGIGSDSSVYLPKITALAEKLSAAAKRWLESR